MDEKDKIEKQDLTSDLGKLSEISGWFEKQEELDIEEGLKKVKEAAELIKRSKARLKEIENEFEEIKEKIEIEDDEYHNGEEEKDENEA